MRINKGYKFRIYPTKEQEEFFLKTFGGCRFVWNYILQAKEDAYSYGGIKTTYGETSVGLKNIKRINELSWLNELSAQSLQQELRKLDIAYSGFFKKTNHFPRFKNKKDDQSFVVPQHFKFDGESLQIPKLKSKIKVVRHRDFGENFKIKSITISRSKSIGYFASFQVEEDKIIKKYKSNNQIGIDLGLTDLMVLSNGVKIKNPKIAKKYRGKLAYQHRQLSKKVKNSKSRELARINLAKTYDKISRIKNDYTHKLTSRIIDENQVIVMEDLSIANMMKNRKLARAIQDVSWGEIVRQLKYKAKWNDRQFIQIDRFFPSSKTCNIDGFVKKSLDLSERTWHCPKCGTNHDRDTNTVRQKQQHRQT